MTPTKKQADKWRILHNPQGIIPGILNKQEDKRGEERMPQIKNFQESLQPNAKLDVMSSWIEQRYYKLDDQIQDIWEHACLVTWCQLSSVNFAVKIGHVMQTHICV